MISRRDLVQKGLVAALTANCRGMGSLLAAPSKLEAGSQPPHFLVFVQIYGAWDVCLAFDPKDRDSRLSNGEKAFDQPYSYQEVKRFGQHMLAPGGVALAPFADRLLVINGIDMELDAGHTPQIVMTGDIQGSTQAKPFVQAILSERHPYLRSCLIPHLYGSYDGYFLPGPYAAKTVVISGSDAFKVLNGSQQGSALARVSSTTKAMAELHVGLDRQSISQYAKAVDQAAELRKKINSGNGEPIEAPEDSRRLAAFIGKLFASGVLGSFTWSLGDSLDFDTHSSHYAQHPLAEALENIAVFCHELEKLPWDAQSSIFDHTTVIVSAEFSRTPRLNASQGKDHNFRSNSLLFLGKNIRAGSYGQSGEQRENGFPPQAHVGLPVDFKTGRPSSDGQRLFMRNIWAGSGDILGIDFKSDFGADTRSVQFLGRG